MDLTESGICLLVNFSMKITGLVVPGDGEVSIILLKVSLTLLEQLIIFSEDVWSQSRVDVMKVFVSFDMAYYNTSDQNARSQTDTYFATNMTEMKMMIETRPRYPSNKLTFTIAKLMKGKAIRIININFEIDSNAKLDVDLFFEDSKRNFLNSLRFFLSLKHDRY